MDEYYTAVSALPVWIARPLAELPTEVAVNVHEVRLRLGQGPCFTVNGRQCAARGLPQCPQGLKKLVLTREQIEECLYTLCGGSVHAHQAELAAGYVTAAGGCRVGVGGQYFVHPERGVTLQNVSSLNLRIARQKSVQLPPQLQSALQTHFVGLLAIGEPDSGKTTLLRRIACTLAEGGRAVAAIDERRELFPRGARDGELPVDIISGLPKGQAMQMALRTLAPSAVVFDELGGMDEVRALEQGFFSGVDFAASLHAASVDEALRRPQVKYLKERGMLRFIVALRGSFAPGQVSGVIEL